MKRLDIRKTHIGTAKRSELRQKAINQKCRSLLFILGIMYRAVFN